MTKKIGALSIILLSAIVIMIAMVLSFSIDNAYAEAPYTITWKNDDGTVLKTDTITEEGVLPSYDLEDPQKAPTAQYTYTFDGWDEEIVIATEDKTYTATYSQTVNEYTVTWEDDDGTELEKDENVPYGTLPTFNGETPTKEATAQYTYAFDTWSPTISSVVGDIVYVATYSQTLNTYTVTWKNENGDVLETDENIEYGQTPTYNGETPIKPSTAQYAYTFDAWTPDISSVTGNVTYTATFNSEIRKYTVLWKNADGSILETDENVEYGTIPTYNGVTPTKAADAQYTYTFNNWNTTPSAIEGDTTYTATYSQTVNKYTITWVNYNDTELEIDENVEYGQTPTYDGETPTKAATAQYTYTFTGWDPVVSTVTGNITYKATFSSTVNKYTITWINYDESVLEVDESVAYGQTPTYNGETPTKPADPNYSYVYIGWTPALVDVTGNAVYKAIYNPVVNKYKVTWKNSNDDVLEEDEEVPYGTMPSYDGETPTKSADAQNTYTFNTWSPEVSEVVGDATYVATYNQTLNSYTIIWQDEDGTELEKDENVPYGTVPTFNGDIPTKATTAQYTFAFNGWDPAVTAVEGNATYKATYSQTVNTYTVTWKNEDGTILEVDENVEYDQTPQYDGDEPTKSSTISHTYAFDGWDNIIEPIEGDTVFNATYEENDRVYGLITWENYDGEVLQSVQNAPYGTGYVGPTPEKPEDVHYIYTFSTFEPEIDYEDDNHLIYKAIYGFIIQSYTITWRNYDNSVITNQYVDYGEMPQFPNQNNPEKSIDGYTSQFIGWSPELTEVVGNADYVAVFEDTPIKYAITYTEYPDFEEVSVDYDSNYNLQIPTKEGYVFIGWMRGTDQLTDAQGASLAPYTFIENIEVTASWDLVTIDIEEDYIVVEDEIDKEIQLTVVLNPQDSTTLTFTSSNEDAFIVNESGLVKCVGLGRAIIRVDVENGDAYDECEFVSVSKVVTNSDVLLFVTINKGKDGDFAVLCDGDDTLKKVSDSLLAKLNILNDYVDRTDLGVELQKDEYVKEVLSDGHTLNINLIYSIAVVENEAISYDIGQDTAEYDTHIYLDAIVVKDGYTAGKIVAKSEKGEDVLVFQGDKAVLMPNDNISIDILLTSQPIAKSDIDKASIKFIDGVQDGISVSIKLNDLTNFASPIVIAENREIVYSFNIEFALGEEKQEDVGEFTLTLPVPEEFINKDGLTIMYQVDGNVVVRQVHFDGDNMIITLTGSGDYIFVANTHESIVYLYWLIILLLFLDAILGMILAIMATAYSDALERRKALNGYSTIAPIVLLGAIVAGEIAVVAFLGLVLLAEVVSIAWLGLKLTNKYFIYTTYHKIYVPKDFDEE